MWQRIAPERKETRTSRMTANTVPICRKFSMRTSEVFITSCIGEMLFGTDIKYNCGRTS
jgi:hypothetical protein